MSHDPGDARDDGDHAAILTAYVYGAAELPPDERHAARDRLARDPRARGEADAVAALLAQLRALPPADDMGDEPDWAAMERSIHHAVAAEPLRPWWRRWRWLVPALTCAAAAAVLLAIARRPALVPEPRDPPSASRAVQDPPPAGDVVALWLDGGEVDVDLSAPDPLDGASLGDRTLLPRSDEPDEVALLPATDLAWVDGLDEAALDRAERWLTGLPAPEVPDGPPARPERKKS